MKVMRAPLGYSLPDGKDAGDAGRVSRRTPAVSLVCCRAGSRISDSTAEAWPLGQFDLHVHTRGEIELHQGIDGLRSGLNDIEKTLVGAHLELLARLLVDVR